jgi:hypothetical protein
MLNLLESEEGADVLFIVEDHEGSVFKTVEDISAEAFKSLLEHIYSGWNPSKADGIKYGKELINAANEYKYELVDLKMVVENHKGECLRLHTICRCSILSITQRVCHIILFVATSRCAQKEHSKQLRESEELLSEMWLLMGNENQESSMSVAELRNKLGKRKQRSFDGEIRRGQ